MAPPVVSAPPAVPTPTPIPVPPPAKPKIDANVVMNVTSRTWRKGQKPHDIATDLKGELAAQGVGVAAEGSIATLDIEWSEEEGSDYKTEAGKPVTATDIVFKLVLTGKAGAQPLLECDVSSELGQTVITNDIYDTARNSVLWHPDCMNAALYVAAALGNAAARQGLFALAVQVRTGMAEDLIEEWGVKPASPEAETQLALVKRDFNACVKIGKPAVETLRTYIAERMGREETGPAITALAGIGDERNAMFFREQFKQLTPYATPEDALPLIGALEKLDDGTVVPALERFAAWKADPEGEGGEPPNEDVLKAAKKAAATIKARLKK